MAPWGEGIAVNGEYRPPRRIESLENARTDLPKIQAPPRRHWLKLIPSDAWVLIVCALLLAGYWGFLLLRR
jgi:hypothetical protein